MTDLDRLEQLAMEATPGPWTKGQWTEVINPCMWQVFARGSKQTVVMDTVEPDATYIAAANPATVLELIQRVRKAESELRLHQLIRAGYVEALNCIVSQGFPDTANRVAWMKDLAREALADAEGDSGELTPERAVEIFKGDGGSAPPGGFEVSVIGLSKSQPERQYGPTYTQACCNRCGWALEYGPHECITGGDQK